MQESNDSREVFALCDDALVLCTQYILVVA